MKRIVTITLLGLYIALNAFSQSNRPAIIQKLQKKEKRTGSGCSGQMYRRFDAEI